MARSRRSPGSSSPTSARCWPRSPTGPCAGVLEPQAPGKVTAIVMVTALGDVTSATRVAAAVDAGKRVSPLLFFQSVPNAVAGYLAARWRPDRAGRVRQRDHVPGWTSPRC